MIKKKVKYPEQLSLIIPVKCCIDSDPRLKIKINKIDTISQLSQSTMLLK